MIKEEKRGEAKLCKFEFVQCKLCTLHKKKGKNKKEEEATDEMRMVDLKGATVGLHLVFSMKLWEGRDMGK